MSVIITHARVRNALAATRNIGKHNIKVITSDSIYPSTSFFSRYSSSYFKYPSYKLTPDLFINSLKDFTKKNKDVNMIMPMTSETFVLSKYRNSFDKRVHIPMATHEAIMKANNKQYLMKFADELGINIPQTYTINDISELKKISNDVLFPAVIKLKEGMGSKGLQYVHSKEELIKEYKNTIKNFNLNQSDYPLIQEYISGTGYGVSMLFNQGDPRAIFTHKRIREYPITGGPSTARISVRHTKMEKDATTLLKELDWHGVAMVEFKMNDITKEPYLMEINPRFWGSLHQAICAGVEFPCLLYTMATEGDVSPVFTYKKGVTARWMLGDCRALIDYIRTDKRMSVLKDFLKLYGHDLYYDDLSINDPLPTIIEIIMPLMNLIKKGKLKFSPED
ncbi:MAG: putative ATP-dependent carboligase, ATP-grasp superfamily [Candidatus Methanomarinus sp.]|nr:MAG: putative ATP-dependent carboligase, ATP-grasp superfamily [ANME-2 cluster archaeon]